LAQSIGLAAIQQGYRVLYRETHTLLDQIAEATIDGSRKQFMELLATVPLLIIDDLVCASFRPPRPRICWRSLCAAMSGPAP
jgi:DNA replication protein DnaC